MNHFVVSARKYRPETFDEVVGQKAVTSTLKNAIENNHLAQGLLFTGPRGVGKTSCARILAKTINQSEVEQDSDFAFNIFELDAASNNSVDDIRNLNDQVRIPPQSGKFKVYIIDEVHMLSQQAFNAFLKTLEEPPKHAIFILATTEKHKIIPTILSRCQVFDFKRITVQDIKDHLKTIAKKEGVEAKDEALQIIAQKSDGAMRDALSTYDRVVSYCGKKLTRPAVAENLNVLDFQTFLDTTNLVLKNDIPGVLMYFNDVISKGYDGQHFISGLASHFRDLLVCKNTSTIELLDVGSSTKDAYKKQADSLSMKQLLNFIDLANTCDFNYKLSQNKRLHVELCLMKLASLEEKNRQKKKSNKISSPQNLAHRESDSPQPKDNLQKSNKTHQKQKEDNTTQVSESEPANDNKQSSKISQTVSSSKTKKNALSLKAIQYKKEHQKQTSPNQISEKILDENYTQEDIKSAWINFAEIVDKKGEKLLASTLLSDIPKLKENCIEIQMPNETMKIEIIQNKDRILKYIQNTLQNTQIDLKVHVNATQKKKYVHTKEEKYERLKEINPKIELLKQKLDLDF
ncbi:DNA polymerase III subunit gamma/tau [Mesohalobacter halotolerans]|uniref:DNA polymerase III subunit gamma/tau n=1 Tax=Mesohalobacter halotolerans TaxID=1883405 RepID=A0A4U5TSC2_9FLAO|nr:DNA polymerase III subunit gamma/tau [Mesohalobacter halotolerans]TKS56314.1 DNA polymerase III subunit gamma/tau [Mesohalobacter halotolerans]